MGTHRETDTMERGKTQNSSHSCDDKIEASLDHK